MTRSHLAIIGIVSTLVVAAAASPYAVGRIREAQLARAAPELDAEVRRHLVMDSDRAWFSYCRKEHLDLEATGLALRRSLHSSDFMRFERIRHTVESAGLRVARALGEIHGLDAAVVNARRNMALPARLAFQQLRREARYLAVIAIPH